MNCKLVYFCICAVTQLILTSSTPFNTTDTYIHEEYKLLANKVNKAIAKHKKFIDELRHANFIAGATQHDETIYSDKYFGSLTKKLFEINTTLALTKPQLTQHGYELKDGYVMLSSNAIYNKMAEMMDACLFAAEIFNSYHFMYAAPLMNVVDNYDYVYMDDNLRWCTAVTRRFARILDFSIYQMLNYVSVTLDDRYAENYQRNFQKAD